MNNKTLAIFGIAAYILSVLSSATDLQGNPTAPVILIVISGIATIIFVIIATIRLWKEIKWLSTTLATSFVLTGIGALVPLTYGSSITVLLNIVKVVYFFATIGVIIMLFKLKDNK